MKYIIEKENKCLFIDDNKQRLINTLKFLPQFTESDIREVEDDEIEQAYDGSWYVKGYAPEKPAPTKEEVEETRKQLYTAQVDPITAQISRLRDEEQTEEIVAEIVALKVERSELVAKIKEENPYPVEETV